jgi:hypothetical protein
MTILDPTIYFVISTAGIWSLLLLLRLKILHLVARTDLFKISNLV